jgi:UDP-2,3-diacylglucosamine hydrolase
VTKRLGLLAGSGRFPVYLAEAAKQKGYEVIVIGPFGRLDQGLNEKADKVLTYRFARFGELEDILKREDIRQAVMAGKIEKRWLYEPGLELDQTSIEILKKLPDRKDDTLLNIILRELEERGIEILETADLIRDWLAPQGSFSSARPDEAQWRDIRFGFKLAKEIGRLDIGQTVAVLNQAALAVEAIEGTDMAIIRAGQFTPGAVVVKVFKPGQSNKADVPVVGLSTVKSMVQAKAAVLAVEAGGCLVVEREEMVALADKHNIALVGIEDER